MRVALASVLLTVRFILANRVRVIEQEKGRTRDYDRIDTVGATNKRILR
jgi:hypothetical protein